MWCTRDLEQPLSTERICSLELRDAVAQKLADDWSSQQISGWLRGAYEDDTTM